MANVQVNATISARDAASKQIKTINSALGKLGNTASQIGADFRKVALGIVGVAAGVGAFTASAIKDAAADQAATAKLNTALKARGLATESVLAAVEKQIAAGQKLAFTDDEVRASIEASTRFTKNYAIAQKIQTVAMDLARVTGMTLADATIAVGRAYAGTGAKVLKSLGITQKTIKGTAALSAILSKTRGSAKAYGETLEGSFSSLAIGAQELKEQFGDIFLPAVTKLFKALGPYVSRFQSLITSITPKLSRFADNLVDKIIAKLPMFMSQLESEIPKALIGMEQFLNTIDNIGKTAEELLGPGGKITALITGIGAAVGGLKGAITANLLTAGLDPFTALIVANIAAEIPAALAAAMTNALVTRAIAAYGARMAASSAAGAAAAAAASAAAGGAATGAAGAAGTAAAAGGAAAVGGVSAATVAGAAALPFALAAGLKALGVTQIAQSGLTPAMIAAAQAGTTNNIYIGTGKVDTVITDSINRIGTFKRGR